jgi:hypothetical protein
MDGLETDPGRRGQLLQEVNLEIERMAQQAGRSPTHDWQEFFCECGAPGCDERVELSLQEYETVRLRQQFVLAPGHSVSRGEAARHRATELREAAAALQAQAAHQCRRSHRLKQ